MSEHFPMADLVARFDTTDRLPLTAVIPGDKGEYNDEGVLIPKPPETREITGVLLPISTDTLNRQDNGGYTSRDRKFVGYEPLPMGTKIIEGGTAYTIDRETGSHKWTDVFAYYARVNEK